MLVRMQGKRNPYTPGNSSKLESVSSKQTQHHAVHRRVCIPDTQRVMLTAQCEGASKIAYIFLIPQIMCNAEHCTFCIFRWYVPIYYIVSDQVIKAKNNCYRSQRGRGSAWEGPPWTFGFCGLLTLDLTCTTCSEVTAVLVSGHRVATMMLNTRGGGDAPQRPRCYPRLSWRPHQSAQSSGTTSGARADSQARCSSSCPRHSKCSRLGPFVHPLMSESLSISKLMQAQTKRAKVVICLISFFIITDKWLIYTETWKGWRSLRKKTGRRFYLPPTLTAEYHSAELW